MSKHIIRAALMVATMSIATTTYAAPAFAEAQPNTDVEQSPESWRLSTGVNYSTGSYGELTDTKVLSSSIGLKFTKGNFSVRVSAPFVHVDGPGSLIQTPEGSGGGSSGGSGGGSGNSGRGSSNSGSGSSASGGVEVDDSNGVPVNSKRSGLGDVVVAATYSFDLGSNLFIDASGKIKVPTASTSKRLGTGEVDVTTALDVVKEFGPATIYVHGRRKFAGKPTGSVIRSTWGAGAGASIRASKTLSIGADYDWQQSSLIGNLATRDVTGWASFRLNRRLNMSLFASTGLNSNSADFAGGLSISFKLN